MAANVREYMGLWNRLVELWGPRVLPIVKAIVWFAAAVVFFLGTAAFDHPSTIVVHYLFAAALAVSLVLFAHNTSKGFGKRTASISTSQFGRTENAPLSELRRKKMVSAWTRGREYRPYLGQFVLVKRSKDGIKRRYTRLNLRCGRETMEQNLLSVGPPGTFKTAGFVSPNLLHLNRSILVVDPKGEVALTTARTRARFGKVIILNPFSTLVSEDYPWMKSMGYNPLALIDSPRLVRQEVAAKDGKKVTLYTLPPKTVLPRGFVAACTDMAAGIIETRPDDLQPHFALSALELVAGLIMWECATHEPDDRSFKRVRSTIGGGVDKIKEMVETVKQSGFEECAMKMGRFKGDTTEINNIFSSANTQTAFLDQIEYINDLEGGKYTDGQRFRFEDMKREKITLFLILPAHQLEVSKGGKWLRLLVSDAISAFFRSPRSPRQPSVLVMLDEFANLGYMEAIVKGANTLRAYGATLWFFIQSLGQLEMYGRAGWESLLATCGTKTCFKTGDLKTAHYFSQLAGTRTEIIRTETTRHTVEGDSYGYHAMGTPLYRPDDLSWGIHRQNAVVMLSELSGPVEVHTPGWWEPELKMWGRGLPANPYALPNLG